MAEEDRCLNAFSIYTNMFRSKALKIVGRSHVWIIGMKIHCTHPYGRAAEPNHSWARKYTLFFHSSSLLWYCGLFEFRCVFSVSFFFFFVESVREQWPNVYTTRARTCFKFQNTSFYSFHTNYTLQDMYVTESFVRPKLQLNAQLINSETIT